MVKPLLNQEEGIHEHHPWNNPNAWAASTGERVTIRHTAATLANAATLMTCPGIGNALDASNVSPNHQRLTRTLMVSVDSPLLLSDRALLGVAMSPAIQEGEHLTIPLLTWIQQISLIHQQHLHPPTRQVVFHHRLAEDKTRIKESVELIKIKLQDHPILQTGCPSMLVTLSGQSALVMLPHENVYYANSTCVGGMRTLSR